LLSPVVLEQFDHARGAGVDGSPELSHLRRILLCNNGGKALLIYIKGDRRSSA
jgi:hypothetical protein